MPHFYVLRPPRPFSSSLPAVAFHAAAPRPPDAVPHPGWQVNMTQGTCGAGRPTSALPRVICPVRLLSVANT